jgi:hypothetical protein
MNESDRLDSSRDPRIDYSCPKCGYLFEKYQPKCPQCGLQIDDCYSGRLRLLPGRTARLVAWAIVAVLLGCVAVGVILIARAIWTSGG